MQKGSPPRGRGKEAGCGPQKSHARITPAWAGKRRQPSGPCAAPRDHPRVGGEKPAGGQHRAPKRGITPAWAGKRSALVWVCAKPWDHPRVGGEKTKLILLFRFRLGSPPRWRGKVRAGVRPTAAAGITPALAGKRVGVAVSFQRFKDHPRVGGEKPAVPACCLKFPGSPPRWRGKVVVGIRLVRTPRITPALAGKSGSLCPQDRSRGDHPRVGGEKLVQLKLRAAIQGSPPRWRGKADHSPHGDPRSGITPALAGKRIVFSAGYASFEDHPRVGGEKLYCIAALFSIWGSPPRWRGKALLAKRRYGVIGITPALAGKRAPATRKAPLTGDHPRVGGEKTKKIP